MRCRLPSGLNARIFSTHGRLTRIAAAYISSSGRCYSLSADGRAGTSVAKATFPPCWGSRSRRRRRAFNRNGRSIELGESSERHDEALEPVANSAAQRIVRCEQPGGNAAATLATGVPAQASTDRRSSTKIARPSPCESFTRRPLSRRVGGSEALEHFDSGLTQPMRVRPNSFLNHAAVNAITGSYNSRGDWLDLIEVAPSLRLPLAFADGVSYDGLSGCRLVIAIN